MRINLIGSEVSEKSEILYHGRLKEIQLNGNIHSRKYQIEVQAI